jgi:hypothetical protein
MADLLELKRQAFYQLFIFKMDENSIDPGINRRHFFFKTNSFFSKEALFLFLSLSVSFFHRTCTKSLLY